MMDDNIGKPYSWCGVVCQLRSSSTEGSRCYREMLKRGITPPWASLFDILTNKNRRTCFIHQDNTFQVNVLCFIEEHIKSVPKILLQRFMLSLSAPEHIQHINQAIHKSDSLLLTHSSALKRKLNSPELPDSKHVCPESNTTEVILPFHDTRKITDDPNLTAEDRTVVNDLCLEEMLTLEISELVKYFETMNSTDKNKIGCEDLCSLLDRVESASELAFRNTIRYVVTPFIYQQKVCTRAVSSLLKRLLLNHSLNIQEFVLDVLRTCDKQISGSLPKLLPKSSQIINGIISGFRTFDYWSENVTMFLISVIDESTGISDLETVLRYLTEFSDENSSKSCTLVIKILNIAIRSKTKSESMHNLLVLFSNRNNSFLKKMLVQKLDDLDLV